MTAANFEIAAHKKPRLKIGGFWRVFKMREENNALRPRAKTFNKPKQRVMKNENNLFAEFKPSTYEEWKEASEKTPKRRALR